MVTLPLMVREPAEKPGVIWPLLMSEPLMTPVPMTLPPLMVNVPVVEVSVPPLTRVAPPLWT